MEVGVAKEVKPPAPLLPTPPPHAAAAGARSRTRVSLQLAARQPGMERVAGGGGGGAGEARGADAPPPPPVAAGGGGGAVKGKSCKGYLFYSSSLRSRDRGPVCAGITRAIPQGSAPPFICEHMLCYCALALGSHEF